MAFVYVCTAFDTALQQCSEGRWIPYSQGPLPPLSVEEAQIIGAAVVGFWVICAILRILRQELAKL